MLSDFNPSNLNGVISEKRVTLKDIAARLGVSHVTISLALRNDHSIPPSRREQVKRMAEEMGYQPDPFLSSLAAYRRRHAPTKIRSAIAWITHWKQLARLRRMHEFQSYWSGADRAAKQFGFHLEEIEWTENCSAKRLEKILLTRGIRGVLIPPHRVPPDWGDFDWNKFSVLRFGMSVKVPDSNLVTSDQFRAVVMAVTRIKQYGYQRIGLIVGQELDVNIGGNYHGAFSWVQTLLKLRPALPSLRTNVGEGSVAELAREKQLLKQWLLRHKPDAVLTTDPETPAMLRELGYRIPQDIAVAGTSVADVPIEAGIDQRSEEIGRIAAEMLIKQISVSEKGEPPAPCRILVESTWKDGKSLPRRTPG